MKFAIVSDTHDNVKNFLKIIDWLHKEKINLILHCGDISRFEIMEQAEEKFKGEIKYVKGNADFTLEDIPEKLELAIGGKRIACVHYNDVAKRLAESKKYDVVFYGHTHKPWEEMVGACRLVNPGEVAGQRFKPTFALYDPETDKLELKILEKL
jgi:putative phosphoesterase